MDTTTPLNPTITPTQVTPIVTSSAPVVVENTSISNTLTAPVNSPSTPSFGGLNIDQMLGTLGQKTDIPVTPVVVPTVSSLGTNFNIEAMSKPIISSSVETIIPTAPSKTSGQGRFSLVMKSPVMRSVAALFGTILFVAGGLRFMSVQYPIEAEDYKTKILGIFSTTTQVVQNNLSTTGIDATGTNDTLAQAASDLTAHGAAPAYDESTPTPLADAIAAQQETSPTPTSTEQTRDTALDITGESSVQTVISGDTQTQDTVLGGLSDALIDPATQKAALIQDITAVKTATDTYLTQQTASNKGTIARVISKNADSLLAKVGSASPSEYDALAKEVEQLKGLVQKLQ